MNIRLRGRRSGSVWFLTLIAIIFLLLLFTFGGSISQMWIILFGILLTIITVNVLILNRLTDRREYYWKKSFYTETQTQDTSVQSQWIISRKAFDFGTMLPGRRRWLHFIIGSKTKTNTPMVVLLTSDEAWIKIRPYKFTCRYGEYRTVRVGVDTSKLPLYLKHQAIINFVLSDHQREIPIKVRVALIPNSKKIALGIINILMGSAVGLISIGLIGGFIYWLFKNTFQMSLLRYGILIGALLIVVLSIKIQDTLHLGVSLIVGTLVGSFIGLIIGIAVSLVLNLLITPVAFPSTIGWSILAGESVGIIYVMLHPEIWDTWFS